MRRLQSLTTRRWQTAMSVCPRANAHLGIEMNGRQALILFSGSVSPHG